MKRIAKIILYQENKILLQLRDNNPNIPFPNRWSLFGGEIKTGESPEQAIEREVREEIGSRIAKLQLLSVTIRKEEKIKVEDNVFVGEVVSSPRDLVLTEGKKMQFFSKKERRKQTHPNPPFTGRAKGK